MSKEIRFKVTEILEENNFDPFYELIEIARHAKSEKVRCDALMDLCSYVAPKLKHIEISADDKNPFVININLVPSKQREMNKVVENEVKNAMDQECL